MKQSNIEQSEETLEMKTRPLFALKHLYAVSIMTSAKKILDEHETG